MALGKNRGRIFVRGLGNLQIREKSPTLETAFSSVGHVKNVIINVDPGMIDIPGDNGQMIDSLRGVNKLTLEAGLLQSSKDELDLLLDADGKLHAMRYGGMTNDVAFQYHCIEEIRLVPGVNLNFIPNDVRLLPLKGTGLWQDAGYDIPLLYILDAAAEIRINDLVFWGSPELGLNAATAKLLDISGLAYHGTINSDFATIWQTGTTPARFLRFDGVNDQVDFGNILSMNSTDDFFFELWVRIQGADASQQEIMSKKAGVADEDGWSIIRSSSNVMLFKLSDGAASATFNSGTTLLQNVWKHVAFAIDRNGNITGYFNGAAVGTPVSVAGVADSTSTDNVYFGRLGSAYGQVDIGDVRIYRFGAGNLPSDIAAIALRHYNAQKANYGL